MQIEELIRNKKVLMIPVYSTRSYKTGVYNLAADGNVTKYLMKIAQSDFNKVDLLYPDKCENLNFITNFLSKQNIKNVSLIPFCYGRNAHETRNMGQSFIDEINYLFTQGKKYDIIISEVDTLAEKWLQNDFKFYNNDNFVYWVGSWNADGTRWDAIGHELRNKEIAKQIITPCLLAGQANLYKGKSFYDVCAYDPRLFNKATIFFPFRLSDNSYQATFFVDTINELKKERDDFVVLYTDPNDSHIFDNEDREFFQKVPCNKYVYLSILKGKPIIPYFDNPDINYHTNIFEMLFYGCDIITFENSLCKDFNNNNNVTFIKDKRDFLAILKRRIENAK